MVAKGDVGTSIVVFRCVYSGVLKGLSSVDIRSKQSEEFGSAQMTHFLESSDIGQVILLTAMNNSNCLDVSYVYRCM